MKNFFSLLALTLPFVLSGQITDSTLVEPQDSTATLATDAQILQEGTILQAALLEDLSGKTANVGQNIQFELHEDLLVNEVVVVEKGAKISGTVTEAARSRSLGRKGNLAFSIDYLYLPSGEVVKLRTQVEKNTKGRGGAVAAGAVLVTPFALFVKGKNAKFEAGEVFTAYIDEDAAF